MSKAKKCGNCRWWVFFDGEDGSCYRYPPKRASSSNMEQVRPIVDKTERACGEWAKCRL